MASHQQAAWCERHLVTVAVDKTEVSKRHHGGGMLAVERTVATLTHRAAVHDFAYPSVEELSLPVVTALWVDSNALDLQRSFTKRYVLAPLVHREKTTNFLWIICNSGLWYYMCSKSKSDFGRKRPQQQHIKRSSSAMPGA